MVPVQKTKNYNGKNRISVYLINNYSINYFSLYNHGLKHLKHFIAKARKFLLEQSRFVLRFVVLNIASRVLSFQLARKHGVEIETIMRNR